jgi:hypothetical protein
MYILSRTTRLKASSNVPDPEPDPPDPHILGLLDPDPGPLVRSMDPAPYPDPSIIMQK